MISTEGQRSFILCKMGLFETYCFVTITEHEMYACLTTTSITFNSVSYKFRTALDNETKTTQSRPI